jgi:hypothetical protein
MGRTGGCWDITVTERFFWSLKHEWAKHESLDNTERQGSVCSNTSKVTTIQCGYTRHSVTCRPPNTKPKTPRASQRDSVGVRKS